MENNSLFDSLKKKKPKDKYDELRADAEFFRADQEARNTNLLVAGATPLLAGLLVGGDVGDSAEIAAKSLAIETNRHQEQDDSLMSYLMRKKAATDKASTTAVGGKKRYQQAPYEDEKGNIKVGIFDTFTGKLQKGETIKGFSPRVGVDPIRGELSRTTKGRIGAESVPIQTRGEKDAPLSVKQEKDVAKIQTEFESATKKIRESMDATEQFIMAIGKDNPIAHKFAQTALAKMAEGGGRLSDQDVNRMGGSQAIKAKVNQFAENAKTGKLTEENLGFMRELGKAINVANKSRIKTKARRFSKTRGRRTGIKNLMQYLIVEDEISPEQQRVNRIKELQAKENK